MNIYQPLTRGSEYRNSSSSNNNGQVWDGLVNSTTNNHNNGAGQQHTSLASPIGGSGGTGESVHSEDALQSGQHFSLGDTKAVSEVDLCFSSDTTSKGIGGWGGTSSKKLSFWVRVGWVLGRRWLHCGKAVH